ncbi:hypothetical protein CHU93_00700 [Sandarakinorhabdus cyanobacteriorum]|uniref:Uncharacterized protein n=1 Tax=Sandarakinorhabdus cyanobacteriorum TaxID=1981098 RepID=A0A255Z801_9SPHN|nr:hypothetical protein [Sandarakinorhabdus cyanobacteriorum]OYQ37024.1 hypothetical protein CHU93_00700 [Sandarakinorhabdus cyanobacteriorum]
MAAGDEYQVKQSCFCCGASFAFGMNAYHGRHISRYRITVCDTCYMANWDGWAPHLEQKIVAHAQAKGIELPHRNSKGWLPRD